MSEPFLALFTHSEVFLSLLEGLGKTPGDATPKNNL